jgi:hypothetical protein
MTMHEHPADYFGAMDPNSLDDYFYCKFELDEAERSGCLPQKLARLGLSSKDDWRRIEVSYYRRHFGHVETAEGHRQFARAAEAARERFDRARWQTVAASAPALLAPAEDVTVELWARISAALSRCRDTAGATRVWSSFGIDHKKFERVDEEFRARMRVDSHGIIAGVYSRAFASAPGVPSRSSRFTAPQVIAGTEST